MSTAVEPRVQLCWRWILAALAVAYFVSYALAYRFAMSAAGVTFRLRSRGAGE